MVKWIVLWVVGYFVSLFFDMLISRLEGEPAADVYSLNSETNVAIYLLLIIVWPLFFLYLWDYISYINFY